MCLLYSTIFNVEFRKKSISSLAINPELANKAVRQHWAVENSLHYVLDVTFREDASRIRVNNAAENMAILRRLALNLVKISGKKGSVRSILKQCAWNDTVRDLIIRG